MNTFKKFTIILTSLTVLTPLLWKGAGGEAQAQSWQWVNRIGGGLSPVNTDYPDEMVRDMVTDSQGNVYACGRVIGSTGAGQPTVNGTSFVSIGGYDAYLAKFDCHGNLVWIKTAGNIQDGDDGISVLLGNDGYLYFMGRIFSSTIGWATFFGDSLVPFDYLIDQDMFLAKVDTAGNLQWVKWANPGNQSASSSFPYTIAFDNQNRINVLIQIPSDTSLFWPGSPVVLKKGMYITKFDTSGALVEVDTITRYTPGTSLYGPLYSDMVITPSNEIYLSGYFNTDSMFIANTYIPKIGSEENGFIAKFNSSAVLQWIYQIAHPTSLSNTTEPRLQLLPSGNIAFACKTAAGVIIGNDTLVNTVPLNNGGAGMVALLSPQGIPIWATNSMHRLGGALPGGLLLDNTGKLRATGFFAGGSWISVFGNDTLSASGLTDSYLESIDTLGNILGAIKLQSTGGNDAPQCIAKDISNNIFVAGGYDGTITYNSNTLTYAGGHTDGFIAKYGTICTTDIQELSNSQKTQLNIYPNPASRYINIIVKEGNINAISILNTLGQTVFKKQLLKYNQENTQLNISTLPPGIYIIQVTGKNNPATAKFIKE
ncbi:MAG TPA: T9SS type A sorting domain-containing protein [Bacteroidia bacterium]|nr:T9SS type A sorting domain-containing protein [Bacteroidia bacterium]HNU33450.1 T9SS type A sorting domain-containing protein [Bacteroidia bacterium]